MIPKHYGGIPKQNYSEDLLDGTYIFHNPFAKYPFPQHVLDHPRIAQISIDERGNLLENVPKDFLLFRSLISTDGHTVAK